MESIFDCRAQTLFFRAPAREKTHLHMMTFSGLENVTSLAILYCNKVCNASFEQGRYCNVLGGHFT
jgi:hypothetical protein